MEHGDPVLPSPERNTMQLFTLLNITGGNRAQINVFITHKTGGICHRVFSARIFKIGAAALPLFVCSHASGNYLWTEYGTLYVFS